MFAGGILILAGILIALYPLLLSLIVAGLFLSAGIVLFITGYRLRKMEKRFDDPFLDFFL